MRLTCLVALVVATASFAPALRPRVQRLDLQPPPRTALAQTARSLIMCASGPLAPFSEDQQATLKSAETPNETGGIPTRRAFNTLSRR